MKKLVVFNHKMYLDYSNVKDYILAIKDHIRSDLEVVVCPTSAFIPFFHGKYDFKLGAQNIAGTFATGEVSGMQLRSLDVKYVLIGHMERRLNFNETNKIINAKVKDAIDNGISPIICLGETKEEKDMKKSQDVLLKQIKEALRGIEVGEDIIFAYDPMWAIGTNIIPTNKELEEVIDLIKGIIFRVHGVKVKVLYGGSVNSSNIKSLDKIKSLDGYLIGRASVDSNQIINIMDQID